MNCKVAYLVELKAHANLYVVGDMARTWRSEATRSAEQEVFILQFIQSNHCMTVASESSEVHVCLDM